jgi:hypothetical protein
LAALFVGTIPDYEDAKPGQKFYQLVKIGHDVATIGRPVGRFSGYGMLKIEKIDSPDRWSVLRHSPLIQKAESARL